MSTNNIHVNIYKFYFLCLPLGHVFNFPFNEAIHSYIPDFSTLIALFGLFVLATSEKSLIVNNRITSLLKFYTTLAVYSIFASLVLTFYLTNPIESPFRAILGDIILYLVFILSVYYNYIILSRYVNIEQIKQLMKWQVCILLFVGFLQYFSIVGIAPASLAYRLLSTVFSLRDLSWLSSLERGVTFFGPEPASASLICYLTIPYILVMILTKKRRQRTPYVLMLLLFAFLFFSSDSSSALISFIFVLLSAIYLGILKGSVNVLKLMSFLIGLLMALMYAVVFAADALNVDSGEGVYYVLMGKFFDTSNYSTLARTSTVINDMCIFADFPLTGVGNGNQGFFFNENVPSWMDSSSEVKDLRMVVANGGGNFFPSFISGFGIIGILLLLNFIRKYRRWKHFSILSQNKELMLLYNISISLFLLTSWYSTSLKSFEIMAFIICLPFIKKQSFNN